MAKPLSLDALVVPVGEEEEIPEEVPEEAPQRDPDQLLSDLQSTLDQLRAQLGGMG